MVQGAEGSPPPHGINRLTFFQGMDVNIQKHF